MAVIYSSGVDDFYAALQRLGDKADQALDDLINGAIEVTVAAWQQEAAAQGFYPPGKSGQGTGAMVAAIAPTHIRSGYSGRYADVYPLGTDAKGIRNAEKAFWNHYGTHMIKPTYWVDNATEAADMAVPTRLKEIWADYLNE